LIKPSDGSTPVISLEVVEDIKKLLARSKDMKFKCDTKAPLEVVLTVKEGTACVTG